MPYADKSVQTTLAGLTKLPSPTLHPLYAALTTPPPDMPAKYTQETDLNFSAEGHALSSDAVQPSLVTLISSPGDLVGRQSPPPTHARLSPPPEQNRLHAGHTPLIPRALSPSQLEEQPSNNSTPNLQDLQDDQALHGPLMLPPQPGDGAEDRIELKALDAELERIAKEQAESEGELESTSGHEAEQETCQTSADEERRSSAASTEVIDGVILKKPKMNMGAPIGQA